MPSLLIIDYPGNFPTPRKITPWTDLTARLERDGISVVFGGTGLGEKPRLSAPTPLGTVREVIDIADLVFIGQGADTGTAMWAMARRGAAKLPLVIARGPHDTVLTPDLWPADAGDLLRVVERDEYQGAIDQVLGTTVESNARPLLPRPDLPAPIISAPNAYRGFGSGDLAHDLEFRDLGRALAPGQADAIRTPPGQVWVSEFGPSLQRALSLAVSASDVEALTHALRLAIEAGTGNGPLVARAFEGRRQSLHWVLFYLALHCPDAVLEALPEALLADLWGTLFTQNPTPHVAMAGALRRGGALLAAARQHHHAAAAEIATAAAIEEDRVGAIDLSVIQFQYKRQICCLDLGGPHTSRPLALTALGCIQVPDLLELEESLLAGLGNANYWVAAGRTHGLANVVRELAGRVPNNTWVSRGIRDALEVAVEFCPPRDLTEMAEWEDFLRTTRSKNLRKAILSGAEHWPMHTGGMTDLLHQWLQESGASWRPQNRLRSLARHTLDPARRELLIAEANRIEAEQVDVAAANEARVAEIRRQQHARAQWVAPR